MPDVWLKSLKLVNEQRIKHIHWQFYKLKKQSFLICIRLSSIQMKSFAILVIIKFVNEMAKSTVYKE